MTATKSMKTSPASRSRGKTISKPKPIAKVSSRTKSVRHRSIPSQARNADSGASTAILETSDAVKRRTTKTVCQVAADTHQSGADSVGDVHHAAALQREFGVTDILKIIKQLYPRRQAWHRAEKSLTNQATALCRSATGVTDDMKLQVKLAQALLKRIEDDDPEVEVELVLSCTPILEARDLLRARREDIDGKLKELAAHLPLASWIKTVRGFGIMNFAKVVAEAINVEPETGSLRCIGDYKSPAAFWKRMGLAVIDGGRQRCVKGNEALVHGYDPERRSVAWVLGDCMLKANKKDGDPYRDAYNRRREHTKKSHPDWSDKHSFFDARRVMTKKVLKDLWVQWRKVMN